MPVYFNALEKLMLRTFNLGPAPMIDIMGGFSFYAISSAIRLNIFDELYKKPAGTEELGKRIGCDSRGLDTLLELLETLGYVKKKNGIYNVTRMTEKWVLNPKFKYKNGFEYYYPTMVELWPYISESIKDGKPHINFYEWLESHQEVAAPYQEFLMTGAVGTIPELVSKINLKKGKVLDIGGSHGYYSIGLCRKFPDIIVSIIDSPYAEPLLKKNIESAGLKHKINYISGDFINYEFNEQFDTILLFNVLHEHEEEYNIKLIQKIGNTLNTQGSLIILDALKEKKRMPMLNFFTATYSLLFYHFLGGQTYSFNQFNRWLKSCGFSKVKRINLMQSGLSLIIGQK